MVFSFGPSRRRVPFHTTELAAKLSAGGFRVTKQRRAVLDALSEAEGAVSALQLFDTARRRSPELGLTTVYRTLELLSQVGAVRRVHGDAHCEAFVPAGAGHGHSVVCARCGKVGEFTDCDLSALIAAASRETGFSIEEHFLQLSGVCSACRVRQPGKAADPVGGRGNAADPLDRHEARDLEPDGGAGEDGA
jgi:Fur family transcriptional regulator, ferric uptake regulator